jgi:hypothetical protein
MKSTLDFVLPIHDQRKNPVNKRRRQQGNAQNEAGLHWSGGAIGEEGLAGLGRTSAGTDVEEGLYKIAGIAHPSRWASGAAPGGVDGGGTTRGATAGSASKATDGLPSGWAAGDAATSI